jgi:hypothetical protein
MKVRLKDIAVDDLDRQSAILLRSFIQTARTQEGTKIEVDDANIVHKVFNMGNTTKNPSLRTVFLTLRRNVRKHLSETRTETHLPF